MAGLLEVQNRILEVAGSQFFNLGFTKVTMDEIAHELGISGAAVSKRKEAIRNRAMAMTEESID